MPSSTTSPDENVTMMRRFVHECQEKDNPELLIEMCHPDFIDHTAPPGSPGDLDSMRAIAGHLHAVFTDIKMEITSCISQGDVIATNKVLRARQVGEWRGTSGTGETVEMRIIDFVTVVDGKFKEHWATVGPVQTVSRP